MTPKSGQSTAWGIPETEGPGLAGVDGTALGSGLRGCWGQTLTEALGSHCGSLNKAVTSKEVCLSRLGPEFPKRPLDGR